MRYLITFSYDGSKYFGYQKQIRKRTVQSEIEAALKKINKSKVTISASGRTDRGVHAIGQRASFDLKINISAEKLKRALNSLIPSDIYIKECIEVDNAFHARFNVIKKQYIYKINIGEYNPIEKDYIYQYCHNLDIDSMKKAIKIFEGEHNFKSFTKAEDIRDNYIRHIYEADINIDTSNIISISFMGDGFLRYMVRNMVGLLIEIGEGKRKVEDIKAIFEAKDRRKAGKTAPAEGLYLVSVHYDM